MPYAQHLRKLRKLALVASLLAGAAMFFGGYQLVSYSAPQVTYYNEAMTAYQQAFLQTSAKAAYLKLDQATKLFDRSIAGYQSEATISGGHRLIYGSPSVEYAALAQFHKGVALLLEAQLSGNKDLVHQAADAFRDSLRLNPGGPYQGVSLTTANRLNEEALVVKHDLELLLRKHPSEARQPQPAKGQPKQAQPQAPNENPGNMPGHGNPNTI